MTNKKRSKKKEYYEDYFKRNSKKTSAIWKGIKSIIKIKPNGRSEILILDSEGQLITDPTKICETFNKNFVSLGPNIDKSIPSVLKPTIANI